MKILLLNQTFYPDVASTAQHLSDLAAALAERGHEVTVIAGRRAYDAPEKWFPARETWRGVRILRVRSTRFGKQARWRRATDFASFIGSCVWRLAWLPRQDAVVALTTPPLISCLGAWRAGRWRARFCYWVMDLNPDEAVAAGWLRADSVAGRWLERLSRFSLRRADGIIALDRFMRERIRSKGIAPEKISVIPPWSHDREVRFDTAGRAAFRAAHGLQDRFVVMYSGNHSPVHPLDTLLEAAERLKADASLAFCFIGGGSGFEQVRRRAHAWHQAANGQARAKLLCLPYRPLPELSASLSAADAHVVVMGNAFVGLVHPCKIYNILAVGAPVLYLGPRPSHVTEILEDGQGEHPFACVAHGEAGALAEHIRNLQRQQAQAERRSRPEQAAEFSQGALLPRLVSVIEQGTDGCGEPSLPG